MLTYDEDRWEIKNARVILAFVRKPPHNKSTHNHCSYNYGHAKGGRTGGVRGRHEQRTGGPERGSQGPRKVFPSKNAGVQVLNN